MKDETLERVAQDAGVELSSEAVPRLQPGWVNVTLPGIGPQPGCLAMEFGSAAEMNAYFEAHPGHTVVGLVPASNGGIIALVNFLLGEEDTDKLRLELEVQQEARRLVFQREQVKQKAEAGARLKQQEKEREEKELAALGRKCRDNHGALIEENKTLKARLAGKGKGK